MNKQPEMPINKLAKLKNTYKHSILHVKKTSNKQPEMPINKSTKLKNTDKH